MMIGRSYFLCFKKKKKKNQLRKTVTLLSARKWPCVSPLGSSCWEPWTSRESGSGKGAAPGSLTSSVSAAFFLEPSLSPCESHGVLCLRWVACVTHSQPAALSNCSSHFLSFLLSSLLSPAHSRSPSLSTGFVIQEIWDHLGEVEAQKLGFLMSFKVRKQDMMPLKLTVPLCGSGNYILEVTVFS